MRIDTKCEVINNRFSEELAMWRSIGKYKLDLKDGYQHEVKINLSKMNREFH